MLTLNGIPTEIYENLTIEGDAEFQGRVTMTAHHDIAYDNEVVCYENEVVTYTD